MPPRGMQPSALSLDDLLGLDFGSGERRHDRDPSFNARALDLASDLGDNKHGPDFGGVPGSFTTQLEMAAMRRREKAEDDSGRVSRIMLARMTTLEEGFRDVLKEVKGLRKDDGTSKEGSLIKGGSVDDERPRKKGKGRRKEIVEEPRFGSSV